VALMHVKPEKMTEKIMRSEKAKAIKTAEEMIVGKTGIIAGSRILSGLRFELEVPEEYEEFLTFVAIDSETDDLPVGREREFWSPEALKEKDVEIQRCEVLYRKYAIEACESIIKRWKDKV
jgi:hypothetical protein